MVLMPLLQLLPAMHTVHVAAPAVLAQVPIGHCRQPLLLLVAAGAVPYVPTAQEVQLLALLPMLLLYVPCVHCVQLLLPL